MIKFSYIARIKKRVLFINIAIQLFDSISTGSSLNPDEQNEDINFDNQLGEYAEYDEDNDKENEEDITYEKYNFKNTIEQIFKTEKVSRNTDENDPRRFEDADI
jgi:hypothetical protein